MNFDNIMLFLPFGYGFNTRAKTIVHKISFVFFILMPILLNALFMTSFKINYVLFAIVFSAMYIVYEIGYIYNDTYTARKEEKPTKWIKTKKMDEFVQKDFPVLISIRVFYVCVLVAYLSKMHVRNLEIYVLFLGLLNIAFSLHNYFRNVLNILTDGAVNFFKYLTPLIIFTMKKEDVKYYIFLFFETIIVRMVEFGIGNKYTFLFLDKINVDVRRVIYYLCLLIVAALLTIYNNGYIGFFIGALYMLLYRSICLIAARNKEISSIRFKNGNREDD